MTDLSTDLGQSEGFELSTQLDEGRPTEASPHKEPAAEEKKPESRMDAIKRAADDLDKAAPPKAEEKPEAKVEEAKEPKPEAAKPVEDVKPEAEKKAETPTEERQRRQPIEAPANFLPRSKELWQNTPHEVRADMQRVITEAQTEAAQYREASKEYEAIKPYAEMAKQGGTTIDVALGKYVNMEQAFRTDPARGFRELAQNMQMTPAQMIGHIAAAYNVRPEQLGAHMAERPHEYTFQRQPQQQQPQRNTEVEALKATVAQMQQKQVISEVERDIIAPFRAENPRYEELKDTIASFLGSAIIPQTLSPHDRLAAAYDMAVRISPSTRAAAAPDLGERDQSDSRAGDDFGGTKSVRGAPASGVDVSTQRRGKMSRGDAIKAAMSEVLAH